MHVAASVGVALDLGISHLVFPFLWPFLSFPLSVAFDFHSWQVCSRPRSRGRTPKSFASKWRGGRGSDALLLSRQSALASGGEAAARVGLKELTIPEEFGRGGEDRLR